MDWRSCKHVVFLILELTSHSCLNGLVNEIIRTILWVDEEVTACWTRNEMFEPKKRKSIHDLLTVIKNFTTINDKLHT